MTEAFVSGRGRVYCRGCNGPDLFSALNLGDLPIANELWANINQTLESFPLHLRICNACGLGQVEDVVTPIRLFGDYRYLSSTSTSFIEHARQYVNSVVENLKISKSDWILEIASNDGYLLRNFVEIGVQVLGIEPAKNVAKIATDAGIPTINEFFSVQIAKSIFDKMGHPKLIIANNVMAHVPDLQDFISGLAAIAGPETLISIENPSLMNFIVNDQFDTIYHEHYSYLTAHSVANIVEKFCLELFDVEKIDTHGGSNRYWLRLQAPNQSRGKKVQEQISAEIKEGLFNEDLWDKFSSRTQATISTFHDWLKISYEKGHRVCGYGAAAKASTLLNAAKINRKWLLAIADGSLEKQGWYMPLEGIPIVSPKAMFEMQPTDVIIFPWNIRDELVDAIIRENKKDVRIWQAIPTLEQVS